MVRVVCVMCLNDDWCRDRPIIVLIATALTETTEKEQRTEIRERNGVRDRCHHFRATSTWTSTLHYKCKKHILQCERKIYMNQLF